MKKIYICPMHPDVKSNKPGSCPKCGMDLIEVNAQTGQHQGHKMEEASVDHAQHHRKMAEDFRRRFFVVFPLTIVVLILSPKIQEWFGFTLEFPLRNTVLFGLGSLIALYGGWPFYVASKDELRSKNWGMMTLVSLAVLSGFFFLSGATISFPRA